MISASLAFAVLAICCMLLCSSMGARASTLVAADSAPFVPTINYKTKCPKLRIAIINGVSFHFEILAGMLHVLKPYDKCIDVYMSPWIRKENYDGAWDLVRWSRATFKSTNAKIERGEHGYDLAILISPDYELHQNQQILEAMKPRLTLAMVHNADFGNMTDLVNMREAMEFLSLSPHVAETLATATGRKTDWLLPIYPVRPEPDCASGPGSILGMCLRGFAMQGKFSNLRRNYTSVWGQMTSKLDVLSDPQVGKVFHMNVLGKGPDRLNLPPELETHVTVHRRLPFGAFYTVIYHNLALVPSLANPRYYSHKFSSTIITSFSTGTPVIASQRLLKAYSFLTSDSTFVQGEHEEEIDVMIRIAQLPPEEILGVRRRLRDLREKLNQRSFEMLESFISRVC